MSLPKDTLERIVELARAGLTVDVGNVTYSPIELKDPRKPDPEPKPVVFHTLVGLAEWVARATVSPGGDLVGVAEPAGDGGTGLLLHVASPSRVELLGPLHGRFQQRFTYAAADLAPLGLRGFTFNEYHDQEKFVTDFLAGFVRDEAATEVLRVVGNLAAEQVVRVEDDGVTQSATVKAGVQRLAMTKIANPVVLRPYRTFRDIEQPESPFILRLRGGGDYGAPAIALFDAMGDDWRLRAINAITLFLAKWLDAVDSRVERERSFLQILG